VISKAPIQKGDTIIFLAGFSFVLTELLLPIVKLPPVNCIIFIVSSEPGMAMFSVEIGWAFECIRKMQLNRVVTILFT
jgi:hypothetical protein